MYRIELNGTELKKFLNYLGERYHSQPLSESSSEPCKESTGDLQTTQDIKHFIVSYNRQSKNKYNIYIEMTRNTYKKKDTNTKKIPKKIKQTI